MTDKQSPNIQPTPQENRDYAVRTASIDMAIRSNCGQSYDTEGRQIVDAELIIKAAKIFESFIKNRTTETVKQPGW